MLSNNETMKKLLFISDQICEIYEDLHNLTMTNQEKSNKYESTIEYFENYLLQENMLLDNANKNELIEILKYLYDNIGEDFAFNRCYKSVKDYFLDKYPEEEEIINDIEGVDMSEISFVVASESDEERDESDDEYEDEDDIENAAEEEENPIVFAIEYEDEAEVKDYINYTILRTKISVIKKMYQYIKNTEADNKVDSKYKKALLKELKGFKCDFFFQSRDTEQLGIKCHLDVNKLHNLPKIEQDISSICYNECIDLLDELYLTPSNERDTYNIIETLFSMLCFDEYIKELTPEQIDKLIEACYQIEATISQSFFGNIGLQKLVRRKKN